MEVCLRTNPSAAVDYPVRSRHASKVFQKAADLGGALGAVLLEDRTPLIVGGFQVVPAGSYRFKQEERPVMYAEIYEPLLLAWKDEKAPPVALQIHVLDRKTGQHKNDTGPFRTDLR